MNCPYCAREMLPGCLHNGDQPVQWLPDGEKPSVFAFAAAEKGVSLLNRSTLRGYQAAAFYCEKCKIVIAPTD